MIIISVALPQIVIQFHLLLLCLRLLKISLTAFPKRGEVPLMNQGAVQVSIVLDEVALLLTIGTHF